MKTLLLCVALLQASLYQQALSLSTGAPLAACDTLSPDPTRHGAQPQTTDVPYSIDLDQFCTDGFYSYIPGQTYTGLSMHAPNDDPQLRGVLIQSRVVADESMVGSFAVNADSMTTTRLSSCTRADAAITHSNGDLKDSVYFDWTAPANGTGIIRFRFAVVQQQVMYWADQSTARIGEAGSGVMGDACGSGASQLTSVGFSTLLMVALAVAVKIAL